MLEWNDTLYVLSQFFLRPSYLGRVEMNFATADTLKTILLFEAENFGVIFNGQDPTEVFCKSKETIGEHLGCSASVVRMYLIVDAVDLLPPKIKLYCKDCHSQVDFPEPIGTFNDDRTMFRLDHYNKVGGRLIQK